MRCTILYTNSVRVLERDVISFTANVHADTRAHRANENTDLDDHVYSHVRSRRPR